MTTSTENKTDKVYMLLKDGGIWTTEETMQLITAGVTIAQRSDRPYRIIAFNMPRQSRTLEAVLGHSKFTAVEIHTDHAWYLRHIHYRAMRVQGLQTRAPSCTRKS